MAGNQLLVRFRNLQLRKAEETLLEVSELDLWAGTCQQITGVNGAGKSRLLRVLAGLERPERGEVQVNGPGSSWDQARPWLRSATVFLHQSPYLFDTTVISNVAYGLRRRGLRPSAASLQSAEALEWAGMGQLGQRRARSLSPGERQRVAILRARVLRPRLLLLDEPLAELDELAAEQTRFLLRRLLGENMGVVVATNHGRSLQALADRTLAICAGHLQPVAHGGSPGWRQRQLGNSRGERAR